MNALKRRRFASQIHSVGKIPKKVERRKPVHTVSEPLTSSNDLRSYATCPREHYTLFRISLLSCFCIVLDKLGIFDDSIVNKTIISKSINETVNKSVNSIM